MTNFYTKDNLKSFKSLIGIFIKEGKKAKALSFFIHTLESITKHKERNVSTLAFLRKSLNNIYPELSYKRIGRRKVFYLPKIITDEKKIKVGMDWLRKTVTGRKLQLKLKERIAKQIIEAYYNKGETVKKKKVMYQLLLDGRPFLYILKHWRFTPLELQNVIKKLKTNRQKVEPKSRLKKKSKKKKIKILIICQNAKNLYVLSHIVMLVQLDM